MDNDQLKRCIGKLFLMGFEGTSLGDDVRALIEDYHVGAFLLTSRNVTSVEQVAQLTRDLQLCAYAAGHEQPLLIAIDQENGGINTIYDKLISQFPSAMGIAACDSPKLMRDIATASARELRFLGINWLFGPTLDILSSARSQPLGVRSFGDDPITVSAYGIEAIKGYKDGGIAICGKHFPSFGDIHFTDGSPSSVPSVSSTIVQLQHEAFGSFCSAIQNGLEAMLVGGCAMTGLDRDIPHACLSESIVTGVLRQSLKFDGVVVSECLSMEALYENIGVSQGTVSTILAGCDMVMVCQTVRLQLEALCGLKTGIKNNIVPMEIVHAAGSRVDQFKAKHITWDQVTNIQSISMLREFSRAHRELSTEAYRRSITVVRDYPHALDHVRALSEANELLLLTPLVELYPSTVTREWAASSHVHSDDQELSNLAPGEVIFQKFGRTLAERFPPKVTHMSYSSNGLRPIHEQYIARADVIIVITADAVLNAYQYGVTKYVSMLSRYQEQKEGIQKPVIVVAVSSPYDFLHDPDIGTYICTFDFTVPALDTLVGVLAADFRPTGTVPLKAVRRNKRQLDHASSSDKPRNWLVEEYDTNADNSSLDAFLESIPELHNINRWTRKSFYLKSKLVQEKYFVVRNSSTRVVYGLCATYIVKAISRATIAMLLVKPEYRKKGIGNSLFAHALKYLLNVEKGARIHIGSLLPSPIEGYAIVKGPRERRTIEEFAVANGHTLKDRLHTYTMIIRSLLSWSIPEHINSRVMSSQLMFEIVPKNSSDMAAKLKGFLASTSNPPDALDIQGIQYMYELALGDGDGSKILCAKGNDGSILASMIIRCGRSNLDDLFPIFEEHQNIWVGGLSINGTRIHNRVLVVQAICTIAVAYLKSQKNESVMVKGLSHTDVATMTNIGFESLSEEVDIICTRQ